jgi:hypothetical protein
MMNFTKWFARGAFAVAICLAIATALRAAEEEPSPPARQGEASNASKEEAEPPRLTLAEARQRAKLMHRIYAATLESMHRHYFHGDRSIVPARAMEDIFSELHDQERIEARWISVNTKAMSIDHEPETAFEKQAASQIADGKQEVESVEKEFYQRAGAIPLAGGCVGCHMGTFGPPPKSPRFAGLVIRVPIRQE